jgi:hypothetical protein
MRATYTFLLLSALTACRISGLGNCSTDADCSAGAGCDLAQRVCVPTDSPAILDIAVSTPAGYTDPNGRAFFDTAGTPLSVSASISGRAGVDPATVCLRIAGESGACLHPGTAGSGTTFTFALPRPSGSFSGTTPLDFTLAATSPTGRSSTSAVQHVYFDNQPPAIVVAADPAPYARSFPDGGSAPIAVSVTIADPTGVVSPQLLSGSNTLAPASVSGSAYTFALDPADAPAGVEGPYTFQVRATDGLGHQSVVAATRTIDGAPPTLAVIKIYNSDAGEPDAGVAYPALVANTGWTGSTFIYNDVVHVKGSITDVSGIASASLRVNGIDLDGGVATGAARPLGCTATSATCAFDLVLALNDAQNGAFHTGTSTFDAGASVGAVPAGMLQIAIDAQDNAVAYGGTPAAHLAPTSLTPARTTRLLWLMPLGFAAVSGLAVHPSGDLIVTMDGGTVTIDGGNAVYDLAPDQPRTRWGVTLSASAPTVPADGVNGPPAIGAGDATSARIYVASAFGDLYALNPDGGAAWTNVTLANSFVVGPSVAQANTSGGTVDEMIVPDGVGGGNSQVWRATSGTDVTSIASANRDFHAAPLILDGGVYFATQTSNGGTTHLTRHPLASDGTLDAGVIDSANPGVPYFGLVTDGKNLYAATRPAAGAGILVGVDSSLNLLPGWDGGMLTDGLAGEPTFGIDGKLYGANLAGQVFAFDAGTGAATPFVTLTGVGMTPLQGSDGHVYFPRRPSSVDAYDGNLLSWTFQSPGPILRYGTMDCAGRLFVASGATVYAFLTDDHGLADTPWPSLRRDARNTGNAGAPKYGIRTPPNTCNP